MGHRTYTTSSLDLTAWLMAHNYELLEARKVGSGRHELIFADPEGTAADCAVKWANSLAADVLDKRMRVMTIIRSGQLKGRQGRERGVGAVVA